MFKLFYLFFPNVYFVYSIGPAPTAVNCLQTDAGTLRNLSRCIMGVWVSLTDAANANLRFVKASGTTTYTRTEVRLTGVTVHLVLSHVPPM